MKKISLGISLGTLVLLTMITPVNAVDYTSQGSVTFEADTSKTDPVDPLDPTTPVKPTDPVDPSGPNPGTTGPVSIDFASSFQFGKNQKISTLDKIYYAQPQTYTRNGATSSTTGPNYIQVTDKSGTKNGWNLSVKQEKQFSTSENDNLDGATLSFTNANAYSAVDNAYAPTIVNGSTETKLTPGTSLIIMNAPQNKGMGTWLYRLGNQTTANSSVKLSVPGKSVKLAKEYKTSLTWTLANTPVNP